MAQFHTCENPNKASRKAYPYLLDIQPDLLADLQTTVGVPLMPADCRPSIRRPPIHPVPGAARTGGLAVERCRR